jgi:PST family polysaccharide transporter
MRSLIVGVLKTGSGALANLLIGVVSVKVMAVMLGPAGTGLFSLIRQAVFTLASLGSSGQTALIQGIASKQGAERDAYVRTAFLLFIFVAFTSVILIELFAPIIALTIFDKNDVKFIQIIRWIGLPVFLLITYIYLKGLLNGFRAIGRLALVEILGPVTTLLLVYPICLYVGEGNALGFIWLLSAAQFMMVITSLIILYRAGWLSVLFVKTQINTQRAHIRYFLTISGTTFLAGILATGTLLFVRTIIKQDCLIWLGH